MSYQKIRKISVGPDPVGEGGAMKYAIGQKVGPKRHEISLIVHNEEKDQFEVFVRNDNNESQIWKTIGNSPYVILEHDLMI